MKDPNPTHDYFPEALLKTFPDANIIEMHRHPADVCSISFLFFSFLICFLLLSLFHDKTPTYFCIILNTKYIV